MCALYLPTVMALLPSSNVCSLTLSSHHYLQTMALLSSSCLLPALSSAVAGTCLLPTAQQALRVFSRSSSFLSLTAPKPLEESSPSSDTTHETVFTWTFAPLARELTRTAGGFEHRARWPLQHGSTLLDLHLNNSPSASSRSLRSSSTAFTFASSFANRPYSSLSKSSEPVHAQQCQEYTSAATLELPEQLQQPAAPGVLSAWLPKAQPRLKGFSRKLVLRQVNRKIIARVARRFTIGIPVLGEWHGWQHDPAAVWHLGGSHAVEHIL